MIHILCIETSENKCSIALSTDGQCTYYSEKNEEQSHAKLLTLMIGELMDKNRLNYTDLDAVCVVAGPGSYTGLRIGLSTAKGICWVNDTPLLSLTSTEVIVEESKQKKPNFDIYIASLDARRNEVFMAVFDSEKELEITKPVVLDQDPLQKYKGKSIFIAGSGATKFLPFNRDGIETDSEIVPNAKHMCNKAYKKFLSNMVEDLVYFEPKYFKAVYTTVSTKKIFS